jgi:hypothetical protein
LTDDLSAV